MTQLPAKPQATLRIKIDTKPIARAFSRLARSIEDVCVSLEQMRTGESATVIRFRQAQRRACRRDRFNPQP